MSALPLLGRVVVVAGEQPALGDVAAAALQAGAQVAVVSRGLDPQVPSTVRFRANPGDRDVWDRVAMHVEQHLGPVDGVATDVDHAPVLDSVFATDLTRRGHGNVVTVQPADDAAEVVTRLCGTPPAERPRPGADVPGP